MSNALFCLYAYAHHNEFLIDSTFGFQFHYRDCCARHLFQCLQGPMEEDILKSHFEKIIKLGQRQHYRRNQNDSQDLKQMVNVHNSHVIALSHMCPNNLNGNLLTPLDLCDTNDASTVGYQDSHVGGLALPNQGSVPSIPPTPRGELLTCWVS